VKVLALTGRIVYRGKPHLLRLCQGKPDTADPTIYMQGLQKWSLGPQLRTARHVQHLLFQQFMIITLGHRTCSLGVCRVTTGDLNEGKGEPQMIRGDMDPGMGATHGLDDVFDLLDLVRTQRDFALAELGRAKFQTRRITITAQPFLALMRDPANTLRNSPELSALASVIRELEHELTSFPSSKTGST
jgi:hypothetical protein